MCLYYFLVRVELIKGVNMHTVHEIENDIYKVEDIKVQLSETAADKLFLTKYSDHNPKQLDAMGDMEDLHERIAEYIDNDQAIKDSVLKSLMLEKRHERIKEKVLGPYIYPALMGAIPLLLYILLTKLSL